MRDKSRTSEQQGRSPQIPPPWPQGNAVEPASPAREAGADRAGQPNTSSLELEGVYVISVAARILEMHPQTLRKYERLGLINPVRTMGMLRLYSLEDIRRVLVIRHLMENLGLNLAGVEFALTVVDNVINMGQRLGQAAEGTPLENAIREEVQQLFRNLNLPVSDL